MTRLLVLGLTLALAGCSLAPSDKVLEALEQSERSWCVSLSRSTARSAWAGAGFRAGR